jgi:hypothetical protein
MSTDQPWPSEDAPAKPRSRRRGCKIVLGVMLLAVVALVGSCLVMMPGLMRQVEAVQRAADGFLDTLAAGRLDEAYAQTSPEFQRSTNLEQFKAHVVQFAILKGPSQRTYQGMRVMAGTGGTRGLAQVLLTQPPNSLVIGLTFREANGRWLVDGIQMPGTTTAPR